MPDASIYIDTRPLPIVLFTRAYRYILFTALALGYWLIVSLPTPSGLSGRGQRALAIFAVCLVLWLSRALPLAVTSLLAITMLPLAGVMSNKEAFSLFGNQAVFFILGAFILSAALMKSGLSARITLAFTRRFGASPNILLLGLLMVPGFLSFWMPEHAVAAMMFPIVLELAHALDLRPGSSRYGEAMFLAMAWGAAIGGTATFLGGARNALAVGILREATGGRIGFFEWMAAIVPIAFLMLLVAYAFMRIFYATDVLDISNARDTLEKKNRDLGPSTYQEKMVGAIALTTILAWILLGHRYELASIAIIAVTALFVFRLVKWRDLEEYVNWGIILMYGGAIALGFALESTGAAAWLAKVFISSWAQSPAAIIAAVAAASILLTEGMSNAAVVAMLMPVGLGIAKAHGIDSKAMVYAIAVPAGLGFAIPMGNPPNAIAFSSGFVNAKRMFLAGAGLDVAALIVFLLVSRFWWPLLGIGF